MVCDNPIQKPNRLTAESAGTNKEKAEAGIQTAFNLNAGPLPRPAIRYSSGWAKNGFVYTAWNGGPQNLF